MDTTHIAGTFLIQADGSFLNGAGLGVGEDRNVTIPKTFRDGRNEVPYVSAQAWKRWLRMTAIQEARWPASEPQAIGWNPRGNVNKIASQLNPVEFPEDDIFGYMRAQEGQGRRMARATEDEAEDEGGTGDDGVQGARTRAIMRSSPFAASLLVSVRSSGWRGQDEGYVHLTKYDPRALAEAEIGRFIEALGGKKQEDVWKQLSDLTDTNISREIRELTNVGDVNGVRERLTKQATSKDKRVNFIERATSPLPYTTRFYNTHLQGIFCLDYSRLGVFWNLGDRIELDPDKVAALIQQAMIEDVTSQEPYSTISDGGRLGKVYRMKDFEAERKRRATDLIKALAVLRGGAKQAQFGTDIAPKALILAGLSCGNPIFNHLFEDDGGGPRLKIDTLAEVIQDYADRIVTPVFIGIRKGYLVNEEDISLLSGRLDDNKVQTKLCIDTPIRVAQALSEVLSNENATDG